MHRSRLRQISALVLALFVALGMSASVVQASNMMIKMAAASGMDAGDHEICDGCGDSSGDSADMKATGCGMAVCAAPVLAALPQTLSIIRPDAHELPLPTERLLSGSTSPPDPYPPRSSDLG